MDRKFLGKPLDKSRERLTFETSRVKDKARKKRRAVKLKESLVIFHLFRMKITIIVIMNI